MRVHKNKCDSHDICTISEYSRETKIEREFPRRVERSAANEGAPFHDYEMAAFTALHKRADKSSHRHRSDPSPSEPQKAAEPDCCQCFDATTSSGAASLSTVRAIGVATGNDWVIAFSSVILQSYSIPVARIFSFCSPTHVWCLLVMVNAVMAS